MYVIFVNKRKLILKREKPQALESYEKACHIKDVNVEDTLNDLFDKRLKTVYLYGKGKKKMLKKITSYAPLVKAAGGLTRNPEGKILFIFRNGKWDLPKGKIEKKEAKKAAAIREVEEETGVTDIRITSYINETYHVFKQQELFYIKKTYWYEMATSSGKAPKPQEEEGITEATWKAIEDIPKLLENSYPNIGLLLDKYNAKT